MNCRDVDRLMALEDAGRRPDLDALRAHAEVCVACRDRHAEVLPLLTAPAPSGAPWCFERPRSRWSIAVPAAAAAVLVVAVALAVAGPDRSEPEDAAPRPEEDVVLETGRVATVAAPLVERRVEVRAGRRIEYRLTRSVWTPPTPRCLKKETAR